MTKQISKAKDLASFVRNMTAKLSSVGVPELDPFSIFTKLQLILENIEKAETKKGKVFEKGWMIPRFEFHVVSKEGNNGIIKRRHIGAPNLPMKILHKLFESFIKSKLAVFIDEGTPSNVRDRYKRFVLLPSAKAFVVGSRAIQNTNLHINNEYFYKIDFRQAYDELNTDLLTVLLVALVRSDKYMMELDEFFHHLRFGIRSDQVLHGVFNDPLMLRMKRFVETFCRSIYGRGLITGAPSSPYLFNLYCEMMLNKSLRYFCREKKITFSQYADDLVFSSLRPIWEDVRKKIRAFVASASFGINHRKSQVLYRRQGTVTITGFGISTDINGGAVITFPGKKRRALRGMLRTFLARHEGNVDVLRGHVTYFKHYARFVAVRTKSDRNLLALCSQFESAVSNTTPL